MAKRMKKILVRHRNLNGDEVVLQRKVLSWWAVLPIPFFLIGVGYRWKDWKLLNSELYEIEEKISKKLEEIQALWNKRVEKEEWLKREKKDVNDSTRETRGYSAPFWADFPADQISFKAQNWMQRPPGDWRKYLNPKAFKGLGQQGRVGTREKLGLDGEPRATRTAYTPEDLAPFKMAIEDAVGDGVDHTMIWKDPEKQRKKNQNNNNNNQNNNNNNRNKDRNRNQNNDDDDNWYDD